MRKLREAAVVALMVGSVGMLGAGTAAAHVGKGADGHKATSYSAKSQDAKKAKRAKKGTTAQDGAKTQKSKAAEDGTTAQDEMGAENTATTENGTATESTTTTQNGAADGKAAGDPNARVHNPQRLDCDYENNNVFLPVNLAITVWGDATAKQNVGNVCPQTGPTIDD